MESILTFISIIFIVFGILQIILFFVFRSVEQPKITRNIQA